MRSVAGQWALLFVSALVIIGLGCPGNGNDNGNDDNAGNGNTNDVGTGDGTFSGPVTYALAGNPYGLVTSDFPSSSIVYGYLNGDSHVDRASIYGDSVLVELGKTDGSFQPGVAYYVSYFAVTAITLGDVNGDGVLDICVAFVVTDAYLGVFLGNGDGTFGGLISTKMSDGVNALGAADFDSDGDDDIAAATYLNSFGVQIMRSHGNGKFGRTGVYSLIDPPESILVDDLDGDGVIDVAVKSDTYGGSLPETLSVLLGNP